jgi:site-specific DNA-methyltransferase (adenine-specific)
VNVSHRRWTIAPSTVGRGKVIRSAEGLEFNRLSDEYVTLSLGDSLDHYPSWKPPTTIVSDGGYGVLGFEGDTSDHLELPTWYEPHIAAWSTAAKADTTLWFWNSEIGWATVHPVLERYGWRYVNANVWNKGAGHIAGNVNTSRIRRFPVVTEMCVQYVFEARISGQPLREWLLSEWKRTGLPLRKANEACGVADAAVRKYFDQGHLWYFPPPEKFDMLATYANQHGRTGGRPYFSTDGINPMTAKEWARMRSKFQCPHGFTNVWSRSALRSEERVKTSKGRAVHLNQKPLDLIEMIIRASSEENDVVWEPFGGLFTACLAARKHKRFAYGAEIDPVYFQYGMKRFTEQGLQDPLL